MKNNNQLDFPPSILDENRIALDQNESDNCIFQETILPEDVKTLLSHIILLALPTPSAHLH